MTNRKETIQNIVKYYVQKFTCGSMADTLRKIDYECEEANAWLREMIDKYNITKDEIKTEIKAAEQHAKETGTACCYDMDIIK